MSKKLFAVLFLMVFAVTPFATADFVDNSFVGAFDFAQPSIVQWGGDAYAGGHKVRGADEWLIVGMHISACTLGGRLRSCSLGVAWGSHYVGVDKYGNGGSLGSGFNSSLLVTAPQGIRLNPDDAGLELEWNLNVTPFFDATSRRFGFMIGFSVGG